MSTSTIETLKSHLHKAAFLVTRPDDVEAAHREILRCLVLIEYLERDGEGGSGDQPGVRNFGSRSNRSAEESAEIAKVERRLRLWAKRPTQINAQILKAFLHARRDGAILITEQAIRERMPVPRSFESNFAQMKVIAPKNHGKVFEQQGLEVKIWEPVKDFVREFERNVF